jgi:hypothetical protein
MSIRAPLDLSALLDAERVQAPPPGALERDFVKLTDALAQGVEPVAIGSASLQAGSSLLAKVTGSVALGAVVGLSAAGGAHYASAPVSRAPLTASSGAPVPNPVVERSALPAAAAPSELPPSADVAQRAAAAPVVEGPRETRGAAAPRVDAGFDAELELIELAKKDVDSGQPHLAAVWLAEHARRHPSGVFVPERRALQVLVACAQQSEQGPRLAAEFMRMYPASAFLDRVKRACQGNRADESQKKREGGK